MSVAVLERRGPDARVQCTLCGDVYQTRGNVAQRSGCASCAQRLLDRRMHLQQIATLPRKKSSTERHVRMRRRYQALVRAGCCVGCTRPLDRTGSRCEGCVLRARKKRSRWGVWITECSSALWWSPNGTLWKGNEKQARLAVLAATDATGRNGRLFEARQFTKLV
jgi:hypothetical protein